MTNFPQYSLHGDHTCSKYVSCTMCTGGFNMESTFSLSTRNFAHWNTFYYMMLINLDYMPMNVLKLLT